MTRIEAILFDFDGVLADTEPIHHRCWAEVLDAHGIELDWQTYLDHCIGISERDLVAFVAARSGQQHLLDELWAEFPRKQELFRRHMLAHPPISPDVMQLIESLGNYALGVVTSTSRPEVEPALISSGLLNRFAVLVCAEDVQRHKPAPDPYLLACRQLRVRHTLAVEDSQAGLASARAAGCEVLYIPEVGRMPELVRNKLMELCR